MVFYRGTNSIKGHANFVAVEVEKSTKTLANTAAAAMGVASMVVGQYYMTQINDELGKISDGISQIYDFLVVSIILCKRLFILNYQTYFVTD